MASSTREVIEGLKKPQKETPLFKLGLAVMKKNVAGIFASYKEGLLAMEVKDLSEMTDKILEIMHQSLNRQQMHAFILEMTALSRGSILPEKEKAIDAGINMYLRKLALSNKADVDEITRRMQEHYDALTDNKKTFEENAATRQASDAEFNKLWNDEPVGENATTTDLLDSYWNTFKDIGGFFGAQYKSFADALTYAENTADDYLLDSSPKVSPRHSSPG